MSNKATKEGSATTMSWLDDIIEDNKHVFGLKAAEDISNFKQQIKTFMLATGQEAILDYSTWQRFKSKILPL